MNNMPKLKIGVVAVSRDCFPEVYLLQDEKHLSKLMLKNMEKQKSMNARFASWKVKFTWFRL